MGKHIHSLAVDFAWNLYRDRDSDMPALVIMPTLAPATAGALWVTLYVYYKQDQDQDHNCHGSIDVLLAPTRTPESPDSTFKSDVAYVVNHIMGCGKLRGSECISPKASSNLVFFYSNTSILGPFGTSLNSLKFHSNYCMVKNE